MIIYVKSQCPEKIRPVKWSDDPQSQHNSIWGRKIDKDQLLGINKVKNKIKIPCSSKFFECNKWDEYKKTGLALDEQNILYIPILANCNNYKWKTIMKI